MLTLTKKLQGFRKELRKRERQQQIATLRYNQQLYLQQLEYQQSGDYGTVLLHSIYQKSENIQKCSELLVQYPLKTMYFLLEKTFDNTTHQSFVIKILENYFFHGISKNPQEEMADNLLRILQLRNSSLKLILLIFYAIIQDNQPYTLFLIQSKKYIQLLCKINEAYSNNTQVRYLMIRTWHIISKISSWNNSLADLINPLMALANYTESKQIPFIVQSIVNIAKLCPQKIVQKLYKKGILRLCDIYARKFRSVSLHYLTIFYLSSTFATDIDIEAILSFIFDHSANHVAYQEYIVCPSNQSISEMSLQLLTEMMTVMDIQLMHTINKIVESKKILSKLGAILQNVQDKQNLSILLTFIKIYQSNKALRPQEIKLAEALIDKIQKKMTNSQHQYQQQPLISHNNGQNNMQIEYDQQMI